jgi:hypothetical protein
MFTFFLQSRSLRGAFGALALAIATAGAAYAAETPADLVLPPLTEAAPAPSAWPELGSAQSDAASIAVRRSVAEAMRIAQPSKVNASANWSFESNSAGMFVGTQVVAAGDLNGDGISDFAAIGTVNSFNTGLYIFLGSTTGATLAPGFPVTNLPKEASIAAAGDVNNDGRDDLAMFWPQNGDLRLYFGSATGLSMAGYNNLSGFFPIASYGLNGGPAGDVNGDGYGDVIFGVPDFDGSFPCSASNNSGEAVVMYGTASGLSASNDWIVTGCYATGPNSYLGTSVAGAGDVNGDGYDDIVVGAWGAETSPFNPVGKAYVMYGSATGFPLVPGFSNLGRVTDGTAIVGQHIYGGLGQTVAAAGDLNGDGFADVAIGSPGDDNFGTDAGLVQVFRGTPSGVDTATANRLWWESSGVPNSQFGITLSPAGDLNGDSRPDLLVGEVGRVDVAQGWQGTFIISQTLPYAQSTTVVVTAGDVNGDGMSDVLVGDRNYTNGQANEGRLLVHQGAGDGPNTVPGWSITQAVIDNPNLGWSVASAGDVNGDGYDDVLVGEPTWYNFTVGGSTNNGLVQLFYGHATGLSPSYDWFFYGANNDQLGVSVCGADLNGDGYSDIIAGGHTAGGNTGQVRIWYGGNTGPSPAASNVTLSGFGPGTRYFGAWVAPAGDTNGDGYPDLIVGEPYGVDPVTPLSQQGRAYVYKGSAAGIVTTPIWARSGLQVGEHFGQCVSGAGDVNGDGFADVVIGAPDFDTDNGGPSLLADAGRAVVVLGSPSGPGPNGGEGSVLAAGWRYGAAVAGAGDVNGDGYSDVIIGAPGATGTISGEGAAVVLPGYSSGVGGTMWAQYGGEAFGGFGSAVSSAGDADGDGLSDVLVGAVFQDAGGAQDQGRVSIFRGPLPAGAPAFWNATGGSSFANIGHSLANAGDVNGDGWTDLVFGLPGYAGTGYRQGLSRLYYGAKGNGLFQLGVGYRLTAPAHFVQPGCLSDAGSLVLLSTGRSAAGRGKVRLQYRVSPVVGLPAPVVSGFSPYSLTGAPGANGSLAGIIQGVSPLTAGVPYSWQVRTLARNTNFPTGPWRSPARSGRLETDFRVPGAYLDVADGPARHELMMVEVRPNPMVMSTSVVFSLSHAGNVSLAVHDIQGRLVRTLARGSMPAGEHRVAWDGGLDDGGSASAGVYLVRLEAEGRVLSRKVVRVR